jgi:hypothetical protein
VLAGAVVAVGTLPAADHLQDHMTSHFHVDER